MNIERIRLYYKALLRAAIIADDREVPLWRFDGEPITKAREVASAMGIPREEAIERMKQQRTLPGWEGAVGPFPSQYGQPHVYARDVHSGAGNCVCGKASTSSIHVGESKDLYAETSSSVVGRGVGTRTQDEGISQRANALAYGRRRRRRHKRRSER